MHIPTVLSVKDVDEHLAAPRLFDRAGVDIRDLSCAETLRAHRGLSRTRPFETKAPSTAAQKPASGGLCLIVAVALAGLALGGGAALAVSAMKSTELAAALRSFAAPTSLESQGRSLEQLIEGAAP